MFYLSAMLDNSARASVNKANKEPQMDVDSDLVRTAWKGCWQSSIQKKTKNWKEGNVLFNEALNTFYLRLCGIRHMVKDHSDS